MARAALTMVMEPVTIVDASLTVVRAALTRERIAALPEDGWLPRRDPRRGREGGRGLRLGFLSQLK